MRECYLQTVEGGGPDMVWSAIGFNESGSNQGLVLPCDGGCLSGRGIANVLKERLQNGNQPVEGMPPSRTASTLPPKPATK